MGKTLTLELPDEVYEAVKGFADASGKTPAEWIAADLGRRLPKDNGEQPFFKIPKEVYAVLQQMAVESGRTTEEMVAEYTARHAPKPRPPMTEEEARADWERLMRHAGAVSSGDPQSADNDRIDADLAREYGSTHEEEA